MSTGAAISYAQVLAPERAEASVSAASDHYPLVDLAIVTPTLARVREVSRLGVAVTSSEELANLFLRIYLKTASGGVPIGSRTHVGLDPVPLQAGAVEHAVVGLDTTNFSYEAARPSGSRSKE